MITYKNKAKLTEIQDPSLWVNKETGETFKSAFNLSDNSMVSISESKIDSTFNIVGSHFLLVYDNELNLAYKQLSHTEIGTLIKMSINIGYHNNILLDPNNEEFSSSSLAKAIGITTQQLGVITRKMEKCGLLYYGKIPKMKTRRKVYVVSPNLLRRGKDIDKLILRKFGASSNEKLEKEPFSLVDVDAMYNLFKEGLCRHELGILLNTCSQITIGTNHLEIGKCSTLQEFLDPRLYHIKRDGIRKNIPRLIELNLVKKLNTPGTNRMSFYLNPTFIRKGNKFPDYLIRHFNDLSISSPVDLRKLAG